MTGVFVAIGIFVVVVVVFIITYETPSNSKKKLTGRGGDFE
jgi:hypothetical protein